MDEANVGGAGVDDAAVEVRFDGQRYGFWQQAEVRESVDDLVASVRLGLTRPGTGDSLGLGANTVASVLVGGGLVSTVRPDAVRRQVGVDSHTVHVDARSLARELVDCQYSLTLQGLKLGEVVKRICGVFKVPVRVDVDTAVVPSFSMQSEVPANALINAVRAANLLLYPLPDGGLVLTRPTEAAPVASLVYGVHIKRYNMVDEFKLRYSDYVVKSYDYANNSALKGAAKDSGITFFRPMHIVADRHGHTLGGSGRRAELERSRRLARAHRIELEVQGWRYLDASGERQPWAINTQVRVIIPGEGVDGVFLVGERAFRFDDKGGSVTLLQVMHRDAFLGAAKKSVKRGAGVKGARK